MLDGSVEAEAMVERKEWRHGCTCELSDRKVTYVPPCLSPVYTVAVYSCRAGTVLIAFFGQTYSQTPQPTHLTRLQ